MFIKRIPKNLLRTLIVLAVFGLLVFFNPYNFFGVFRGVLATVTLPIRGLAHEISIKFSNTSEFLSSIGKLNRENENLTKENQSLKFENAQLKDAKKENEYLRNELRLLPREKFNLLGAYVVSQDPYGTGNWIEINRGSSDGVEKDMPVVVSNGILVGKIGEVHFKSAEVIFITNPKSSVNAFDVVTRAKGIARGEYGLGVLMDMISEAESVEAGDAVMTSEIGNNMPSGLLIGNVEEVRPSPDRLFQQAILNSPVKFSKLQFVFVITNNK